MNGMLLLTGILTTLVSFAVILYFCTCCTSNKSFTLFVFVFVRKNK